MTEPTILPELDNSSTTTECQKWQVRWLLQFNLRNILYCYDQIYIQIDTWAAILDAAGLYYQNYTVSAQTS